MSIRLHVKVCEVYRQVELPTSYEKLITGTMNFTALFPRLDASDSSIAKRNKLLYSNYFIRESPILVNSLSGCHL